MQLRLECYENEKDAALSAISAGFCVSSVSKGYPNTRQTYVQGTPCEYRYYIKTDGVAHVQGLSDRLATDMLRFLSILSERLGYDASSDVAVLRQLYLASAGFTDAQAMAIFSEMRASVLDRALRPVASNGGACNAPGNR